MIKASDLRIGNLVTINNPKSWPLMMGVPVKVIAIELVTDYPGYTGSASLEGQNRQRYGQFDEFIEGIPLSEDWLIRMGCIKNETYTGVWVSPNGISFNFFPEGNCGLITFDSRHVHFYYVHTMQNIFYLTGSELTIKE